MEKNRRALIKSSLIASGAVPLLSGLGMNERANAQSSSAQNRTLSITLRDSELVPTTQISGAKRWNFGHFGLPYDQVSHVNPDGSLSLPTGVYVVVGQMVMMASDVNPALVSINRNEANLAANNTSAFYPDPYYFGVKFDHGSRAGSFILPFSGVLQLTTYTDFSIYTSTNLSLVNSSVLYIFPVG